MLLYTSTSFIYDLKRQVILQGVIYWLCCCKDGPGYCPKEKTQPRNPDLGAMIRLSETLGCFDKQVLTEEQTLTQHRVSAQGNRMSVHS